jgi:hypothetical protein
VSIRDASPSLEPDTVGSPHVSDAEDSGEFAAMMALIDEAEASCTWEPDPSAAPSAETEGAVMVGTSDACPLSRPR